MGKMAANLNYKRYIRKINDGWWMMGTNSSTTDRTGTCQYSSIILPHGTMVPRDIINRNLQELLPVWELNLKYKLIKR